MELAQHARALSWVSWWPVALGTLVLYVPTYYDMAHTLWNTDEGAHGPMVVGVSLWLIWRRRFALANGSQRRVVMGTALLVAGLLAYVIGRSQGVMLLEAGSQFAVLGGILLAVCGSQALRAYLFPLFFLLFSAPLPGFLVDSLTSPLKQAVSDVAERLLYFGGYPIARDGVMLAVGQYQLLVADACSGLHSLFSLSALGLLYIHLMAYRSPLHNGLLVLSILPIAIATNVVRVILLVLVTYHFGDSAAQGFIHGFAGIAMFAIALAALFALDGIFRSFIVDRLGHPLR
jgi:exosortase B